MSLFSKQWLRDLLEQYKNQAIREIEKEIERAPGIGDDAAILDRIVAHHVPRVPTVQWERGKWSAEDTSRPAEGGSHLMVARGSVEETAYIWQVPFEGDERLFRYKPKTFLSDFPKALIQRGYLVFRFKYPTSLSEDEVKRKLKQDSASQRQLLDQYLAFTRQEVEQFEAMLRQALQDALVRRRRELAKRQSVLEWLQQEEGKEEHGSLS